MDVTLTAGDLLTVAGASVAAGIVTQFAKLLFALAARWVRTVAMLSGLIFVVLGTVLTQDETSAIALLLAVVVGMQAGLAAAATFDSFREGLNYSTTSTNSPTSE